MYLRRSAQQVMLYLRYEISILIQRMSRIYHNNYKEAVKLHDKFKKNSQDGAQLIYPKIEEKNKLLYINLSYYIYRYKDYISLLFLYIFFFFLLFFPFLNFYLILYFLKIIFSLSWHNNIKSI